LHNNLLVSIDEVIILQKLTTCQIKPSIRESSEIIFQGGTAIRWFYGGMTPKLISARAFVSEKGVNWKVSRFIRSFALFRSCSLLPQLSCSRNRQRHPETS
jgi:hypothetical protein